MGLFGTNGVRGVLGNDLYLDNIHKIVMSIATHVGTSPILVGHDGRDTSVPISLMVFSSLCYAGINCFNAGLVPTPCLALGVRELGYAAGIMVTASHNPPQYGGLKLIWKDGIEASRDDEASIEQIHIADTWKPKIPWGKVGAESRLQQTYADQILKHVNTSRIKNSGLNIVLDIGNGAQSNTAPLIASKLCKNVTTIHENIDPQFSGRGPEPKPDNLSALSEAVSKSGADIGIAFDGDGDRSIICDEKGSILNGDTSAMFLVSFLLGNNPNSDIVTPINSADTIQYIATTYRSSVIRTKVGSVAVSRKMAQIGALAGFEENGGFMYGPYLPIRDGCMTMALALDAISSKAMPLSEILSQLPKSFTAKTSIKSSLKSINKAIQQLALDYPYADTRDGIKIRLGLHKWVMIRPSGTEPIARIYAESDSKDTLDSILTAYMKKLENYLD